VHRLEAVASSSTDNSRSGKPGPTSGPGYRSWSAALSRPACTHGSSTPGEPEAPTLTGSPPGMAITPGSVTCWRTTGLSSAKRLAYSVVETRKLRAV